eukprot:CCRYP_020547-RA/>CCRYP_020547-RA protein AED:0.45 eAED:0.45 QI:0/0/0/1/0/0/3/0/290
MLTYDFGANCHYLSKTDRLSAGLPMIRPSTKRVGVANGSTSVGKHATALPFPLLSHTVTLSYFPHECRKNPDDVTISILTKDGVTIHKETNVLITCHGKPLLIGVRDEHGRYHIRPVQHHGRWQPRIPSKKARTVLSQAHSIYNLPSTEQAIKWMHAVCGYPVKSTWLKAAQAERTSRNITQTLQRHPRNTSTRPTRTSALPNTRHHPLRKCTPINSEGAKSRCLHQDLPSLWHHLHRPDSAIPLRSQAGNKYIIVMVEIDSSVILVEPIKNRTDAELTRAYSTLMLRLQ